MQGQHGPIVLDKGMNRPRIATQKSKGLSIRMLVSLIFRRKAVIGRTFAILTVLLVTGLMILPAQYKSEMKILIQRERFDPVVTAAGAPTSQPQVAKLTDDEVNSEVDLMQSRAVLEEVVKKTGLDQHVSLTTRLLRNVRTEADRVDSATVDLHNRLSIDPPSKTNLVNVTYDSSDPALSQKVLKALADAYLRKHTDVHRPAGAQQLYDQEVKHYEDELHQNAAAMVSFAKQKGVVSAENEKLAVLKNLSDTEASLHATEASIAATRDRIRSLEQQQKTLPPRRTTRVTTSAVLLEQLKGSLISLQQKRAEMLTKYAPEYRGVKDLEAQIAKAEADIKTIEKSPTAEQTTDQDPTYDWVTGELTKARSELAGLTAQEQSQRRSVATFRKQAEDINEAGVVQQQMLRTQKAAEENYYDSLRKRASARMSDVLDDKGIVNASLAEMPILPSLPEYSLTQRLLVGMFLVLLLSMGVGVIADRMDSTFRTPDEITAFLGVPVLAALSETTSLETESTWPPAHSSVA